MSRRIRVNFDALDDWRQSRLIANDPLHCDRWAPGSVLILMGISRGQATRISAATRSGTGPAAASIAFAAVMPSAVSAPCVRCPPRVMQAPHRRPMMHGQCWRCTASAGGYRRQSAAHFSATMIFLPQDAAMAVDRPDRDPDFEGDVEAPGCDGDIAGVTCIDMERQRASREGLAAATVGGLTCRGIMGPGSGVQYGFLAALRLSPARSGSRRAACRHGRLPAALPGAR